MTITRTNASPRVTVIEQGRIQVRAYQTREWCIGATISRATITINLLRRRIEARWLSP